MNETSKGRLYQDNDFIFSEFNGLRLEKLIVCEDPKTSEPILVFVKVENNNWHQFFLDAGIGFWESWGEFNENDDSYLYIDITNRFRLLNEVISTIFCKPDKNNSKIIIEFKNAGKLILQTSEPEIFDSKSELIFTR